MKCSSAADIVREDRGFSHHIFLVLLMAAVLVFCSSEICWLESTYNRQTTEVQVSEDRLDSVFMSVRRFS